MGFDDAFKEPTARANPAPSLPLLPADAERIEKFYTRALANEVSNVLSATEGVRNDALNSAAYSLGQLVWLGLSEDVIREQLTAAGLHVGLTASETSGTIASGLKGGTANPRPKPERTKFDGLDEWVKGHDLGDPGSNGRTSTRANGSEGAGSSATSPGDDPELRTVTLTPASAIKMRPVHWLWSERLAMGSLALIAGRENIGKSTICYQLAADITRGKLAGKFKGTPKSVVVAATEDSWEHTIAPRLSAAGANLDKVYRVDVRRFDETLVGLSLPRDLAGLGDACLAVDAAMVLLDPLISRLDAKLDTHKDAEVRLALEPLISLADRIGVVVLGLIHVNKTLTNDPLTTVMGSRAFTAVARAVLYAVTDPDDEQVRLLGQAKNNLGRSDLPMLTFTIEGAHVADTDEGPVWSSRVVWGDEREQTIRDALENTAATGDERTAVAEASEWLHDHLTENGGTDDAANIKQQGRKAGHSERTLGRARHRLHITSSPKPGEFPRRHYWTLPGSAPDATPETAPDDVDERPEHDSGD